MPLKVDFDRIEQTVTTLRVAGATICEEDAPVIDAGAALALSGMGPLGDEFACAVAAFRLSWEQVLLGCAQAAAALATALEHHGAHVRGFDVAAGRALADL